METLPRILICDDEPLMTEGLKKILGADRYHIQTTNNPSHALTLIHADSPDLVILDVVMPKMTGFDVLDAVDRDCCHPDFIIITGKSTVDTAIEAIRRGACEYLIKPFEPDELIVRVDNILRHRKLAREHRFMLDEKRQLEEKLRQSQKMEAIGRLAGGIAHDFNNILSIILGNTELALADTADGDDVHQNLDQILKASLRAREMIQQLLNFSRMEHADRQPIVLNAVIDEFLKLIRVSLSSNILIDREICPEPCTIMADATQIDQIMMNLCTNAAHAMGAEGGRLTVRLESVWMDEKMGRDLDGLIAGAYARLVVSDTGHGIDKKLIDKIFDPYFTTKAKGKGTGMGLSVVHGIVKASGGTIKVFSRPGRFTEFHLYFPRIDIDKTESPDAAAAKAQPIAHGSERILVVDDETMLLEMMGKMLAQLGYAVTAHADSTEAFKAFRTSPDAYDLVITDMSMPHMTGIGLTKAIKAERPDVPVLLCTGYNEDIGEMEMTEAGIASLLMKPVGMQELADAIRDVLHATRTERRQTQRHTVLPGTFVISDAHPYKRCRLVDFSQSGLAFHHSMEVVPENRMDRLSILTPDGRLFLKDLACRIVADVRVDDTGRTDGKQSRRRSVCFQAIAEVKKKRIVQFIKLHTAKAAR